jgi:hypothetical protein
MNKNAWTPTHGKVKQQQYAKLTVKRPKIWVTPVVPTVRSVDPMGTADTFSLIATSKFIYFLIKETMLYKIINTN